MQTPETIGQPQGSELHSKDGTSDGRKLYGAGQLPPGAVAVKQRMLARYVRPGTKAEPHGVPPIGIIGLPAGWVLEDMTEDGAEELRVLPFRFPWYSRAYALRTEEMLCAVLRNIQPTELSSGQQVVVQFNESADWTAMFGKVCKVTLSDMTIRTPDGKDREISMEAVHFVGKVMCWWDDAAKAEAIGVADAE